MAVRCQILILCDRLVEGSLVLLSTSFRSIMRSILPSAGQAKHAVHGSLGATHLWVWGQTPLNYPAFCLVATLFRWYVLVTFSFRIFVNFRIYSSP